MSVRSFCALNGLEFAYNRQIKHSENVDHERNERRERSRSLYLREHTEPLEPKYKTTIELWLTQIAAESDGTSLPDDLSSEEARRYLIRFLRKRYLDDHKEIYKELAYK
jgi:death-on-curing protein